MMFRARNIFCCADVDFCRKYKHIKLKCTLFFKLSTPYILAVPHFFSFLLNSRYMLNTYIYHQLPPARFGACYTIFRQTKALLSETLYSTGPQCLYKGAHYLYLYHNVQTVRGVHTDTNSKSTGFAPGQCDRGVKITTHFHLALRK